MGGCACDISPKLRAKVEDHPHYISYLSLGTSFLTEFPEGEMVETTRFIVPIQGQRGVGIPDCMDGIPVEVLRFLPGENFTGAPTWHWREPERILRWGDIESRGTRSFWTTPFGYHATRFEQDWYHEGLGGGSWRRLDSGVPRQ